MRKRFPFFSVKIHPPTCHVQVLCVSAMSKNAGFDAHAELCAFEFCHIKQPAIVTHAPGHAKQLPNPEGKEE